MGGLYRKMKKSKKVFLISYSETDGFPSYTIYLCHVSESYSELTV